MSSNKDQLSMYSRSNFIHSLKSTFLFLPLICHRHVSPGLIDKRLLCHDSYWLTSFGIGGLGPTKLICPINTLNNCGSSSMLNFLKNLPTGVMRGSFFILNT